MQRNTDVPHAGASLCQVLHRILRLCLHLRHWSKGLESPLLKLKHNNTLKSPKEQAPFCQNKQTKTVLASRLVKSYQDFSSNHKTGGRTGYDSP